MREISIGSVEQRASDQPARHRKKKEFIEKRKKQEYIDFSENGKMDHVNFEGRRTCGPSVCGGDRSCAIKSNFLSVVRRGTYVSY